jgi:hypothetical protein
VKHRNTSAARASITFCHHSSEAFDTAFAVVRYHDGLTLAARAVHAACVSLHRLGRLGEVSQQDIADWAHVSLHSVVRAIKQLVDAGFMLVRRRGQGQVNEYTLIGIDQQALDGRSAKSLKPAFPGSLVPTRDDRAPKNRVRRIDRDTSHSGYDVAAYLAHEQATYSEASKRYGVRR